jgi:hypothetical protein
MQIRFQKSGGFAAIRRPETIIDDNALPAGEVAEWRRLVESAGFFNQPAVIPGGPGRDQFQYRVEVELDGRHHTVQVSEGAVPPALKPLIDRLEQAARH